MHALAKIQGRVDSEHAWSESLSAKRAALAERAKGLEVRVAELEGECRDLQEEIRTLRGVRAILETEIKAERELLHSMALVTWDAMESLEGTVADLGVVLPPRKHNPKDMDITLGRLCRTEEVCLPDARAYGDHCAKVAWTTAFASLQRVRCGHVDATRSVPVVSATQVAACQQQTRRASNIFTQDFWASCGHDATMESL